MKKVMSLILIISGMILFLYPSMSIFYSEYQQKKMISDWEANTFEAEAAAETFNEQDANKSLEELNEVFNMNVEEQEDKVESNHDQNTAKQEHTNVQNDATKKSTQSKKSQMMGVIEIDKIGVKLPLLYGASDKNLDKGAGLLQGTPAPGMAGNSAIAAHRNRAYGSMFNRLDEVGKGDIVTVRDKNNTYQYEVYETLVVEPHETSVLNGSQDEKVLTLITCTPIDTATHRLIVKAKIKP